MQLQRVKRHICNFLIANLLFSPICFSQYSQNNLVFRIVASECKFGSSENYSTGFVYRTNGSTVGIVTTLHGVCGCNSIIAYDSDGKIIDDDLTVTKADIESDIALLSSSTLLSKYSTTGYEFSSLSPSSLTRRKVAIIGFPYGRQIISTQDEGKISEPATGQLEHFIDDDNSTEALERRGSPSISESVLNLIGELPPGQSGSPIIYNGEVVGIGNGGLKESSSNTCWAISVSNINLLSISNLGSKYIDLKGKNPNELFLLTCNIRKNDTSKDWDDKEPPGATKLMCPASKVPSGWVLVGEKKCTCCAPPGTWGSQWTITKVKGMLPNKKIWVCEHSTIPKNWVVIDKRECVNCCDSGGHSIELLIQNIEGLYECSGNNFDYCDGIWVCKDTRIPLGWIINDLKSCSCCPSSSNGSQWYIKNINSMPTGSEGYICDFSRVPDGWEKISGTLKKCSACPSTGEGYQVRIRKK